MILCEKSVSLVRMTRAFERAKSQICVSAGCAPNEDAWMTGKRDWKVTRCGRILVEENPVHATCCKEYWCPMRAEDVARQASTSSRDNRGYSSKTSSTESPAARNSRTVLTVMRVPRMVGCPLQMSGSMTMRSTK